MGFIDLVTLNKIMAQVDFDHVNILDLSRKARFWC